MSFQCAALLSVLVLGALASAQAVSLRAILGTPNHRRRYGSTTQGDAYTSAEGQNPGGPGDAFTWHEAESSSSTGYNGVYYNDGSKSVEAGDLAKAGWAGSYAKNNADLGTKSSISAILDAEYATQRGVHTVSGTYEGARAVAGSSSMFGLSSDSRFANAATWTMDSYGPTADTQVATGNRRRSVAFTNIAPQSAAQAGIGSGPAAIATGWEVSSAARSHRDKKLPVTVGSRDSGDVFQAKVFGTSGTSLAQPRLSSESGQKTTSKSTTTKTTAMTKGNKPKHQLLLRGK